MKLDLKKNGKPEASLPNLKKLIQTLFQPRYDTYSHTLTFSQTLGDHYVNKIQLALAEDHQVKYPRHEVENMIHTLADDNQFSSLKNHLEHIRTTLPRNPEVLNTLYDKVLHLPPNAKLARTQLRKFLIACVRRAYTPGCKADACLVLVGKQGIGKSSFWQYLAGSNFFSDAHIDIENKDSILLLRKSWIFEFGELEKLTRKKDAEIMKCFITRQTDALRLPYGRDVRDYPRHTMICATTNNDEDILRDLTGSRRYWVIELDQQVDTALLQQIRDSLWREAISLALETNEPHYLNQEENAENEQRNKMYAPEHPWLHRISVILQNSPMTQYITAASVLTDLKPRIEDQTQNDKNQVAACLKQIGAKSERRYINNVRTRVWINPYYNANTPGDDSIPFTLQ